jgi:hypothetical protein
MSTQPLTPKLLPQVPLISQFHQPSMSTQPLTPKLFPRVPLLISQFHQLSMSTQPLSPRLFPRVPLISLFHQPSMSTQTLNTQVAPSSTLNQPNPSTEHAPAPQLLNPTASTFTPNRPSDSSSNSD